MVVANHESQITNHWKWLVFLSAAEILTMLTFGTYSAALPVLRQQWALSAAQAGAIFAGQQIGYTAAVLVLSTLTDAAGVRMIYLLSAIWNAVFALLFAAFADGFGSALALRALGGMGLAGTYVPGMRLVVETFPAHRRGAAMGVYIACFSLGTSLSLLVTGALLQAGWRTAFGVTSLGPLLAAVAAWWVVRDTPRPPPALRTSITGALRNLRALRFIAAYAAHNWELFGMRAWLPAFLTSLWVQRGMPLTSATARGATFSSLVLLASGLSNAAGGWLSDRLGRRRMIIVFLTASALCSGIIGWSPALGMPAVLMLALLYGLLVTADSSTISTAVTESATAETLGATLAVQSGLGFLVTAISPSLFGAVLDATGGIWGWAFLSLGVAALLGTAAVATVSERR
ncbi:MAG: MFS transporter [Bacillati bacterium ANGP1]|uniref:MFS transporter n=1 Tax=Candidatus Segetimicrobium genomatis TaxID=2569760 RepID=A0A537LK32_9BACT|nr:MAG: MFS transporter [Terrabacteria group bacterium ANGP1]